MMVFDFNRSVSAENPLITADHLGRVSDRFQPQLHCVCSEAEGPISAKDD